MIEPLSLLAGIIILMICSAFFSGVEIAFVSVNKIRLKHLADVGNPKAGLVRSLQDRAEQVLTSILIGNNLSIIGATAFFTLLVYPLGQARAEWCSTLVMTPLVLIFAEIIPKVIFRHKANQLIFTLVTPLNLFFKVIRPVAVPLLGIVKQIMGRTLPQKTSSKNPFVSKEELRYLIEEGQKEGLLEPHERRVIERIFEFGVISVKEVMTRRPHIVSVSKESTVEEAKAIFRRTGFSRLPIEGDEPGTYTGIVHVLDCLFEDQNKPVQELSRELGSVKEDTVAQRAMIEMRVSKQRMAKVITRSGAIVGLVTMQDLITV